MELANGQTRPECVGVVQYSRPAAGYDKYGTCAVEDAMRDSEGWPPNVYGMNVEGY